MIAQLSRSTLKNLFSIMALRGVALGGRFVFVIFATKYMSPDDFGRFGLLAGLTLLIPVIVGLEAYQILLRRIQQEPARAAHTRQFYAIFLAMGSVVSAGVGALTLVGFGWTATQVGLGAVVLLLEHIGLETSRILVNERRPALSVLSVAMRTGVWGVAVPALFFVGVVPAPWTLETVLSFWIVGSLGGAVAGMPVWHLFRPQGRDILRIRHGLGMVREVLGRSRAWMVYQAGMRVLETGGRFVCAWMISDAAAGRFTFISMLASLSYIAVKSVVEPIYYPRLTSLAATRDTYREFGRMNLLAVLGATVCSVLGMGASAWIAGAVPPPSELVGFGFLCFAFAFLSLSEPAHYQLYRRHKDRALMTTASVAAIAMVISSVVATWFWGIAGATAGMMVGALVLLILKVRAARGLSPERADS